MPASDGPLVALGTSPFGRRRDDGDGAVVGGIVLRRGPDGKLYGYGKRKEP